MEMEKVFGYDYVDGKLVVNADEAKAVKFVFEKHEEYVENPPKELVDRVLEIALEKGETLSYEEAKERVPYSYILEYIANEANTEFADILKKGKLTQNKSDTTVTCEPIVSKELWDKVQSKLR